MVTEGGSIPSSSAPVQPDWLLTFELLEAGQYEQVADLLGQAQAATEHKGIPSLAQILAAARRICLACRQCQVEAERYQLAYREVDQREHELRQQLRAILDLVRENQTLEAREAWQGLPPTSPATEMNWLEHDIPGAPERPSLWQRVQSLLRRESGLQPAEGVVSLVSVGSSSPSSVPQARRAISPRSVSEREVSHLEKEKQGRQALPSLVVYCLGPFRVYQDDQPVEDWPSSKGKAIFKYLVTHRGRPVAKEVLMETFWPGAHPDAARNNLNVAIYGLRQALRQSHPSISHVLFEDDCYLLNPDLQIWVDCEAFAEHLAAGRRREQRRDLTAAIREYRAAETLYQGEFLEEDRYEDWIGPLRQRLQDDYLSLLDRLSRYYLGQGDYVACATVCGKMLATDACREEAHRQLMHCYSRQGQHYLALRQYHLCVETLAGELDIDPSQLTVELYEKIRRGGPI